MSEERKARERRRQIVQDEKGFWGFVIIVVGGAIAVLLSTSRESKFIPLSYGNIFH